MEFDPQLKSRAQQIQGIVFDVDGVLTDGRIVYSDDGRELKSFNVQDGASIKLMAKNDIAIAIITGRDSSMVSRRAQELGIQYVIQGATSKPQALDELIAQGFPDHGIAAIGDDLQDIDVFNHPSVVLAMSVPNAHPATLARAHFVTTRRGGDGVAVEVAELLLTAQGKWVF